MSEDDEMQRPEKRTEQTSLRLPERHMLALMRLAAQEDRTVSDVIFRMVDGCLFGMAHRVTRRAEDRNENNGSAA